MLAGATSEETDIVLFRLPPDLNDNFAAAAWRRPERYLDKRHRWNISSFRKVNSGVVGQAITRLAEDLTTGVWKKRHGAVLDFVELESHEPGVGLELVTKTGMVVRLPPEFDEATLGRLLDVLDRR